MQVLSRQRALVQKNGGQAVRHLLSASKKRALRHGLIAAHVVLLAVIVGFVLQGPTSGPSSGRQRALLGHQQPTTKALDQLSSADIAVNIARATFMAEATAVANHADSVNTQLTIVPADDTVVAKPQIVSKDLKSRKDIRIYVTQKGDTISKVAAKFGVTSDTIRWSNGLTSEILAAGKELVISPVNGIVYTVKAGDTPASLAQKFHVHKDELIAFNDAELTGQFTPGERIVIPDGVQTAVSSGATSNSFSGGFAFGFNAIYGYNGYDFGYCTWWAATRRAQVGRPIPANFGNAYTWDDRAILAGYKVDHNPRKYDVVVMSTYINPGHVAFVEDVYSDGRVKISEMNFDWRWNQTRERILTRSEASQYNYIH